MLIWLFLSLICILLTLPIWPYSQRWGYRISAIFGIISIVLLFFILNSITYVEYEQDEKGTEIEIERKLP